MAARKTKTTKRAAGEPKATIGVIGGSGIYAMGGLTDTREIRVKTPFGEPSDAIVLGTLEGSASRFWRDMAAGIASCPARLIFGPTCMR